MNSTLNFKLEIDNRRIDGCDRKAAIDLLNASCVGSVNQVCAIRESERKVSMVHRLAFRLFVGSAPETYHSLLLVGFTDDAAHLSFERGDVTWSSVLHTKVKAKDVRRKFRDAQGQEYLVDERFCIPKDTAMRALEEFLSTGKRPLCVDWEGLK